MSPNKINKRKIKTSIRDRKINIIVNRLMEISLQADNYIYCHQPLSVHQASSYLREVLSFQTSCWNDERCLQVIEKLARIMQGIIQEQQQKHAFLYNRQENFDEGSSSPVYSLPEEDRLELTFKNANSSTEYYPSICKYKSPSKFNMETRPNNPKEKDQINFAYPQKTKDTEIKNISNELKHDRQETNNTEYTSWSNHIQQLDESDEDIAMVINDLTITQKDVQVHEENFLCSQSILHNESLVQALIVDEQCGQGISEFDKEITKLLKTNQTNTLPTQGRSDNTKALNKGPLYGVQNEVSVHSNELIDRPYGRFLKDKTHNNFKNNTNTSQPNKVINKNQRKTRNAKTANTKVKLPKSDKNKKNRKVHLDLSTVTPKGLNPLEENTKSKNKTTALRENTLSWLGNIELVREIDLEEYSVNSLDESFWENCKVPVGPDWNDKHFD